MKISLVGLFQNPKLPIRGYPAIGSKPLWPYLKLGDISQEKVNQILLRLNSLNSVEQLENVINKYAGGKFLSTGDTQRILRAKIELGGFRDLKQVACVRRIGAAKFDAIVRTLSNQV